MKMKSKRQRNPSPYTFELGTFFSPFSHFFHFIPAHMLTQRIISQIVIVINHQNQLGGLDALSISPFLVIDDNNNLVHKERIKHELYPSKIRRAPPKYVHVSTQMASNANTHIFTRAPPRAMHIRIQVHKCHDKNVMHMT